MSIRKSARQILCVTLIGLSSLAQAAQEVARIPIVGAPPGTAALGGGLRFGNNPYISSGEATEDAQLPIDLVPLYLYEGKWLFAHGTSGGIHIVNNDRFTFDVLARYRFQKLDPADDVIYEGLNERKQTLDAGFSMAVKGKWGELWAEAVTDTLNRHQGQELELTYRYTIDRGSWIISPFFSWGWQSDKLANYYFGVSEEEATPDRPAYNTGEAQYFYFGLNTTWRATERILFFANFGFGGADKAIENSPIVDKPTFNAVFLGGGYAFGNVLKPVAGEDRVSEWSWRVNYGYQADGNIISEVDQGQIEKSTLVDTNIAGFTLGRLLTDGPRIDYIGKLALFRHLEGGVTTNDGQFTQEEDFWSVSAYIMAMGKNFGKWSSEEWFRWGFAFGMSYAEKVPLAEQSKQAQKGGNTSQFLNYLELQADFPLRRISKAKWLQDCYVGVTVVHRSGIFGTANILGDVAGGSDWFTGHLECVRR